MLSSVGAAGELLTRVSTAVRMKPALALPMLVQLKIDSHADFVRAEAAFSGNTAPAGRATRRRGRHGESGHDRCRSSIDHTGGRSRSGTPWLGPASRISIRQNGAECDRRDAGPGNRWRVGFEYSDEPLSGMFIPKKSSHSSADTASSELTQHKKFVNIPGVHVAQPVGARSDESESCD